MSNPEPKPVVWMGSSRKDVKGFPADVVDAMGYALWLAQVGEKADDAKRMHGDLRDVIEIVDNDQSGTYRVMYSVKLGGVVYVLHAFQKKSKRSDETPQSDLELIASRLRAARKYHEENFG